MISVSLQGRIQAFFEISNWFWAHENWHPNLDRSTKGFDRSNIIDTV